MEAFDLETLKKVRTIAIFGDIGTGKTALAFKIIEELGEEMPIYFLKHPNPAVLKKFGYHNLTEVKGLLKLKDSVIYWDEPQLSFAGLSDYKRDALIVRLLSLIRQKGNILIFSSSDTRVFSARIEAYVGMWLLKQCDYDLTKQRGKIRAIINKSSFMPEFPSLDLTDKEFLCDCNLFKHLNGKHSFDLPQGWSNEISCAYKDA